MLGKQYVLLALVAMVFMGIVDFLLKKALSVGVDYNALIFYTYMIAGILLGISGLLKKTPLKIEKSILKYSSIVGLLMFSGTLAGMAALQHGNASVIIPIVRMGFVVTAIFAFIFFHEKLTFRKGLGIFFASLSLILLSQ